MYPYKHTSHGPLQIIQYIQINSQPLEKGKNGSLAQTQIIVQNLTSKYLGFK